MKILVVDDDAVSLMALVDVVKSCGDYRIVEATDANVALAHIRDDAVPPMLVCCDIRMPGMSGLELLQTVRADAQTKAMPFVLISMANDAETIKEAIKIGVSGYIVKPFSHDDARDRLDKVLALARSKIMEKPDVTMARLKLTTDRYRVYLTGIQQQLDQLMAELSAASTATDFELIRQRMGGLHSGCTTLGLWRAGSLLKALSTADSAREDLVECLAEITLQLNFQLLPQ